jgi:crotonobetainyl-CoA:carnitine CoA-transferase CaiB-like acyl-CoA transferase
VEVSVGGNGQGALEGWRVLEVAGGVPAAFCGKILAGLGADVLMVEPESGHPGRAAEPRRADGLSARFAYLSASKRSIVVPDGAPGIARVRTLLGESDLLVTDLDRAPLDELLVESGNLVVVAVRPFGCTGPAASRRAHHLTVFHASGEGSTLPSGLGWDLFPERAPLQLGSDVGHFDAGWNAAAGAIAACYDLMRSGEGLRLDVSVQESVLSLNRTRMNTFHNEGVLVGRGKGRNIVNGIFRCADGWAELIGLRDDHWERFLALPDGANFGSGRFATAESRAGNPAALRDALGEWCGPRSKFDVAQVFSGIGAAAGIYAEPEDIMASEQLAHRAFLQQVDDGRGGRVTLPGAPYRLSRTPATSRAAPGLGSADGFVSRESRPAAAGNGPTGRLLEGLRVLDFTWAAAGPYATLLLGFLGADVIKVESARRLDPARSGFVARYDGVDRSPVYNELNLNKRSFQVDLTQPEGAAIVRQLVAHVDVVVDNFRPGVMDRFGLGPEALLAAYPHLVVASSSANGSTGPDAMGAGYASIFAATGGLGVQTGYPDGPPTESQDPMDYRSGAAFAVGILAALVHRCRRGEGQHVDLSSCEVAVASAPDALLARAVGVQWQPRVGNGHRTMTPHDVFPCADRGWVAIAVGDETEWAGLCRVLGRDDWTERFGEVEARRATEGTLRDAISEWTRSRSAPEAAAALQGAGVAAEPVASFDMLADDPHLAARGTFIDIEHPKLGLQRVMDAPWRFSAPWRAVRQPGPLLGADNESVLRDLGCDAPLEPERALEVFR